MITLKEGAAPDFERLLRSAADPMIVTDLAHRVLFVNRAAEERFGALPDHTLLCGNFLSCLGMDEQQLMGTPACFGSACALCRGHLPSVNMIVRDRGGDQVPVTASYSYVDGEGSGNLILITLHDLRPHLEWTERRERSLREDAVWEERSKWARDLHDGIAQTLAGMKISSALLEAKVAAGDLDEAAKHGEHLALLSKAAWAEVRAMLGTLRPPVGGTLAAMIEEALVSLQEEGGPVIRVRQTGSTDQIPPTARHELVQIVREAVANAVHHSGGTSVGIHITVRDGRVTIDVRDDGCGISPDRVPAGKHFGLMFMQERAARLGGRVTVRPVASGGTLVRVLLPLQGRSVQPSP